MNNTLWGRPLACGGLSGRLPLKRGSVDKCQATAYDTNMKVRRFSHKALQQFYKEDLTKGLPADAVSKLRAMFAVLDRMKDVEELTAWPLWKAHTLTGETCG